ncbi:AAA family ATPase [Paraburkholderia sediminicola]|uniref:AAA family ATPase n=1 Tax=Paraburkholderia sediminicola TaxID=458836 RepID=UPI0038BD0369
MSVLQELAKWVLTQPEWQADAVRRAVEKGTLDSGDFDDLTALALQAAGIPDEQGRKVIPVDPASLPAETSASTRVALKAIREPLNVNALGYTDGVEFEVDGLTIVYGENGSGKSGYSRILKAVCRARDQEPILANVFEPSRSKAVPSAMVEWNTGAAVVTTKWDSETPCDARLAGIAVMDSRCARLYVDDELTVNIVPTGVDILQELARACGEVRTRLEALGRVTAFDDTSLAHLKGETAVGQFLKVLSEKSDFGTAEKLATLSESENMQLEHLRRQLSDAPEKRAAQLKRLSQRAQSLETEVTGTLHALSDEAFEKLRDAYTKYKAADAASKLAATELSESGAALSGTGNDPWRELVQSAMKFAQEGPYPGEPFPADGDGAQCVLCQQPLDADAKARLKRFVSFLEEDTQKRAAALRRAAGELYVAIKATSPSALPSDKQIVDELQERASALPGSVGSFISALDKRRTKIVTMFEAGVLEVLEPLQNSPVELLQEVGRGLSAEITELEKTLKSEERLRLRKELEALEARTKLADLLPFVKKAIESASLTKKYSDCAKQTNTIAITKKSAELTETALARGLNDALTRELASLHISTLKLGISLRGQRGSGLQQLKLEVPSPLGKTKLSQILSEGEQRAIAIASFLAEVSVSPGKSGIVLDDPVSSLDVYRREHIANRLAVEAKARQVIVFTHDLAFAWYLTEASEKAGVPCRADRVFSAGSTKGVTARGLPFEAGKLSARINTLVAQAQQAKKVLEIDKDPERYEQMVREGYRRLRDCWERLIEESLFGDVIRRFRNSVQTKLLKRAYVENQDFQEVWEGMSRCSNFTHDAPLEAPPPLPSPTDFIADVGCIKQSFDRISARAIAVEKERVSLVPQAK